MPDSFPQVDDRGWMTISTNELLLPSVCSDCCGPSDGHMTIRVGGMEQGAILLGLVGIIATKEFNVHVPVCRRCRSGGQRKGAILGGVIGLVLGPTFAALLAYFNPLVVYLIPVFALVGVVFGAILGRKIGYEPPVRIKGYSPKQNTVRIRFLRPPYQERFVAAARARAEAFVRSLHQPSQPPRRGPDDNPFAGLGR